MSRATGWGTVPLLRALQALLPPVPWAVTGLLQPPVPPAQLLLQRLKAHRTQGRAAPTSNPGIVCHANTTDAIVCHSSHFPSTACAMSETEAGRSMVTQGARSTGVSTGCSPSSPHPGCLSSPQTKQPMKAPPSTLLLLGQGTGSGQKKDAAHVRKRGEGFPMG